MKAAVVSESGAIPTYGDFQEPQGQVGKHIVRVSAAALSPLTKLRASGSHYAGSTKTPFVPGVDGTGTTEDGRRIYFLSPDPPFGAMAERCVVDERNCVEIPVGITDDMAAAIAIPGMSSWAALTERVRFRAGETVLINGATGTSGRLAIRIAKHLGAQRVVATGRGTKVFGALRQEGADETIELTQDEAALREAFTVEIRRGVDVVLDYLWGSSAETLIGAASAAPRNRPLRFVQIGSVAGETISLAASALRSSSLKLIGSGFGSLSAADALKAIRSVFQATADSDLQIAVRSVPLSQVSETWQTTHTNARVVFVPDVEGRKFAASSQSLQSKFLSIRYPRITQTCGGNRYD